MPAQGRGSQAAARQVLTKNSSRQTMTHTRGETTYDDEPQDTRQQGGVGDVGSCVCGRHGLLGCSMLLHPVGRKGDSWQQGFPTQKGGNACRFSARIVMCAAHIAM